MEDLLHPDTLRQKVYDIVEWKNITVTGYGHAPVDPEEMLAWLDRYGSAVAPYVTDVSGYLEQAIAAGKRILFEAQLGALRDIDFGIYPYTSSSTTLAGYAPIGAGVPGVRLDSVVGIMKAYSTCVGEGPFTCEMFGDEAKALRDAGGDTVVLTKLDVMSYLDRVPVCVAYEVDGVRTTDFPTGDRLLRAKPVVEYVDGFGDVSACRTWDSLPENARKYIRFIEQAVGCRVGYVSVGAGRDEYIKL